MPPLEFLFLVNLSLLFFALFALKNVNFANIYKELTFSCLVFPIVCLFSITFYPFSFFSLILLF